MRQALRNVGDAADANKFARFFKTGKGEYGEGDRFHGFRVPVIRSMVIEFRDAPIRSIVALLKSRWHEERLLSVLIMADQYKRFDAPGKRRIFDSYIENRRWVNNWDIVDSSAHLIVGPQLESGSRELLYKLADSTSLWDRRIAMMATYHFIRKNDYCDALKIAEVLLDDEHDLIHKCSGWMLREVGNRDRQAEESFLQKHYKKMPRTMLRYAIEKFPEARRKAYLNGKI